MVWQRYFVSDDKVQSQTAPVGFFNYPVMLNKTQLLLFTQRHLGLWRTCVYHVTRHADLKTLLPVRFKDRFRPNPNSHISARSTLVLRPFSNRLWKVNLMMSHAWQVERGVSCLYKGQACTDIRWFIQEECKAPVTILFNTEIYWHYENYAGLFADIFHVALTTLHSPTETGCPALHGKSEGSGCRIGQLGLGLNLKELTWLTVLPISWLRLISF